MAFVKELDYGDQKPMSVSSRPQIKRYPADNQSYAAGSIARFEISTRDSGCHIFPQDSYIEGKFGCTIATQDASVDGNAFSFIRSLKILHGSNQLEYVQHAGRLWHVLNDVGRDHAARAGDSVCMLAASSAVLGTNASTGLYMSSLNGLALAAGAHTGYFSFVLPSSLFGSLATKAVPLDMCQASSFYIEIEFESANNMIASTTAGSVISAVSFSDLHYNAKVAILPADVNSLLLSTVASSLQLPALQYKTETKSLAAIPSSFNDKFSFQVSSLNAFLFWHQVSASDGDADNRSMTSRTNNNISSYYLQINGEQYPSQPIVCEDSGGVRTGRDLMELRRAFDHLGHTSSFGILDTTNYSAAAVSVATAAEEKNTANITHKRWVGGIDTNRFNASQDTLLSGTNTQGSAINLVCSYNTLASRLATTLYAAAQYDVIFTVQDGLMIANT